MDTFPLEGFGVRRLERSHRLVAAGSCLTMIQEPGGATIWVLKLPSLPAVVSAAEAVLALTVRTAEPPGTAPLVPST